MRRCDICHTPIPLGEDCCPNCGYRYRTERKASQSDLAVKKKKYMSQFQPHPNPASKKISVSRPTASQRSKKAYQSQKTPRSLVIAITFCIVIAMMIPGIVISVIGNIKNFLPDTEVVESGYEYFSSAAELKLSYPELAKPILTFKEKAENFLGDDSDVFLYESYDVYNGDLDSVYLSYSWYGDLDNSMDINYYYYGFDWNESVHITIPDFDQNDDSGKMMTMMAEYMGADTDEIKQLCLNLYEKNKNDFTSEHDVYDSVEYGDDCILSISLTSNVIDDHHSYLSFELVRTFEV